MHQIVDCPPIRIMRHEERNEIIVGMTVQPDGQPLTVEMFLGKVLVQTETFNPCAALVLHPHEYKVMECLVRVLDRHGKPLAVATPNPTLDDRVTYRQVGWMKCVACSDWPKQPGRMWLGKNKHTGIDEWVDCPECGGTGEVPQYKIYHAGTDKEIDYETFGRKEPAGGLLTV